MRPIAELAAEICTLTGHINATQSCAHWLNWKCGIAMGAAREKVRVARAETEDYLLNVPAGTSQPGT